MALSGRPPHGGCAMLMGSRLPDAGVVAATTAQSPPTARPVGRVAGRPVGRVALVGCGRAAELCGAAVAAADGLRLTAVCHPDAAALAPLRERTRWYTDHRVMLDDGGMDAVVIAAAGPVPEAVCDAVLRGGLPVCVVEPHYATGDQAFRLACLARARRTRLQNGFPRRHHAAVRTLTGWLAGRPPIVAVTVGETRRPTADSAETATQDQPAGDRLGCLARLGPGAFDLARSLLGDLHIESARLWRDGSGVDRAARVELCTAAATPVRVELGECGGPPGTRIRVLLADGQSYLADLNDGWDADRQGHVRMLDAFVRAPAGVDRSGIAVADLVDRAHLAERAPSSRMWGCW